MHGHLNDKLHSFYTDALTFINYILILVKIKFLALTILFSASTPTGITAKMCALVFYLQTKEKKFDLI